MRHPRVCGGRARSYAGGVLRLYEADAGAVTPVVPARPGQLRTYTAAAGEREQVAGLRSYLLADLLRRAGERHGLLVSAWHDGDEAALAAQWQALNIHPLAAAPEPPQPLDVGIGIRPASAGGRWLRAGPAGFAAGQAEPADGPVTAALAGKGLDPLALRLALLRPHYRQPATLSWAELAEADRALAEWRHQVAIWANSPSRPMCAQYTAGFKAAFDDDLDVPAALRVLAALAGDAEIPAGSKFETFVYVDQLLGLDLARDIGKV